MKISTKDSVGILLVVGTATALLVHNSSVRHRETHVSPVADVGGSVTSAVDARTLAFVDVNVLPMDDNNVLRRQVVVVEDGFVTRIGPVGAVAPPEQAPLVQGHGERWVIPGLTDAHVHLGDEAEELLPLFVANGVTTVFNLEGTEAHLTLRDRVRVGEVLGPTIYTSGPFVDDAIVRTPRDAERVVRDHRARGFDFVKLHGDLPAESYLALMSASASEAIPVVGHAPRNLPFATLLEHGQAAVAHAEELIYTEFISLDPSDLEPVATAMAEAGTWLTPGLANFRNTATQWGDPEGRRAALSTRGVELLPPTLRRDWARASSLANRTAESRATIQNMAAFHEPLVRTFHAAGVPMLAGTDAGVPGMVPGFSLHDEIDALHDVGLSGFDALSTATANPGRFVREHVSTSASFGTVRQGARADLLLLADDPRRNPGARREPLGVMVRGTWLDRGQLDRMVERLTADR